MKTGPKPQKTAISWLVACLMFVSAGLAQAAPSYIILSESTRWTYIWCAMILAAGMIIAAMILRKPK